MNKLVIIGNGFDLAHGMNTSYSDFILWHLKEAFNKYYNRQTNEFENFVSVRRLDGVHADYSDRMGKVEDIKTISEFNSKLESACLKFSCQYQFIDKLITSSIINWVDIENEYFKELVSELDPYFKLTGNFTNNSKIIELNKSLDEIKSVLAEYISNLQEPTYNGIIGSILSNLAEKNRDDDGKILFLNFNYTSTIQLYNSVFPQKLDVVNIHGKLKDDKNPVIFGYGDESNDYFEKIEKLNNNELTRHLKSFSYLTTQNYQNLFDFLNKQEFEVHVMGHSLGLSDRLLFNHIFEHEKFKKVQLYYYEYEKDGIIVNDFFLKMQELSRHFKLDSKHIMRTKVVPFNESRPLNKCKPQN